MYFAKAAKSTALSAIFNIAILFQLSQADTPELVVEGVLTTKNVSSFVVDATQFAINGGTEFEDSAGAAILYAAFTVGDHVKAKGSFQSGVLVAESLEIEQHNAGEIEVEGLVTAITSNSITVQGSTFSINGSTAIVSSNDQAINISSIVAGSKVSVKSVSGAPTVAIRIKLKDESSGGSSGGDDSSEPLSDLDFVGLLTASSSGSVTVGGRTFVVNSGTRFESERSLPVVLASIPLNTLVKVEFITVTGVDTARKIEVEDENDSNGLHLELVGPIAAISGSSVTIRGVTAAINGSTEFKDAEGNSVTVNDFIVGRVAKLEAARQLDSSYIADELKFHDPKHLVSFDGRGESEKVVFRQPTGTWFVRYRDDSVQAGQEYEQRQWGLPEDLPISGDYDGDGRNDYIVWRPSNGTWYLRLSSSGFNVQRTVQWGIPGDKPFADDVDGDGTDDFVVWRPSTGTWFAFLSKGGDRAQALAGNPEHVLVRQWGLSTFQPRTGDRDGDGRADLIVVDDSSGVWHTLYSSSGHNRDAALGGNTSAGDALQFGLPSDDYLLGDYDGDSRDDLSVYRRGIWFIRFSSSGGAVQFPFGLPDDLPGVVAAPSSGEDRRDRVEVYRPGDGNHFERSPLGSVTVIQWGLPATDTPVGNYAHH